MENTVNNYDENISMEALLESAPEIEAGKIISGEVVSLDDQYAYVNIGGKTEGRVGLVEFDTKPEIGSQTDVLLRSTRLQEGMYVLSHKAAIMKVSWEKFLEWYKQGNEIVTGKIMHTVAKGAIVAFQNNTGFLPLSQAGDIRVKDAQKNGGEYTFKILDVDYKKRSILLSRRVLVEEEREKVWNTILHTYNDGDVIKGKVVRFVEFGAFVDIGGFEALLHNNDISWNKVFKKKKVLALDEEREFKILSINKEERKISLGLKQMKEDPWNTIDTQYHEGDKVSGVITTITNFGFFVEIADGIEGLVNAAEISWTKNNINPGDLYTKGQDVDAVILNINKEERRLSLGVKQLQPNPWNSIDQRFPVDSVHSCKIKKILSFGIFIELEQDIDGMVHISDLSWEKDIKNISDEYNVGDTLDVKILAINKGEMKISCGVKQLTESPWEVVRKKYPPRSKVTGTVTSIVPFGVFIKLEDDIEGLVHISEVSRNKIENLEDHINVGDQVKAVVLDVDVDRRRVSLSIKHHEIMAEKEELKKIMTSDSSNTVTIGEMIKIKNEGN